MAYATCITCVGGVTLEPHSSGYVTFSQFTGDLWTDTGLVFTTAIGTPIHPRNFARYFNEVCARGELGHWKPNELRHSAISLLSAAGLRAEDIADIVGHVTTRMTTRVYRHQVTPTISSGKKAMERLFAEFGGQLGGQTANPTG